MGFFDSIGNIFNKAPERADAALGAATSTIKLMPWIIGGLAVCVGIGIIVYASNATSIVSF